MSKDLCITQPPSQNTLPGGNTVLRLPAPRQAHSPSQYTGIYGYCSKFVVISPPDLCARPGRRCPHFMLQWRYAEVFSIAFIPGGDKDVIALTAWQICHERGKLSPLLNVPAINIFTDKITQFLRLRRGVNISQQIVGIVTLRHGPKTMARFSKAHRDVFNHPV